MKDSFKKKVKKYLVTLDQYVPVVDRVHGDSHPEFHDVYRVFKLIVEKLKDNNEEPKLLDEFSELRKITNNYTIPNDVCETFAAVYTMIAELDRAYHN